MDKITRFLNTEKKETTGNFVQKLAKNIAPFTLPLIYGAFRQVAAEGRKIVADGYPIEHLSGLTRAIVEPAVNLWNQISPNEGHANPDKFPNGWQSFHVLEEIIEGAGMTIPGVVIGWYLGRRIGCIGGRFAGRVSDTVFRNEENTLEIRMGKGGEKIGGYGGMLAGALTSYEFMSRIVGPILHRVLGVSDFPLHL